jgi:hypothetical protein
MPIGYADLDGVIHTVLSGRITDAELLSYYMQPVFLDYQGVWRELVDGRLVGEMAVTANGQHQLAEFAAACAARLHGGRVAMVASSTLTYGMFRMWELQRENLGFEVQVFRDFDEARLWLASSANAGSAQETANPPVAGR